MTVFAPPQPAFTGEQLAFLRSVDSPTIANAIEAFAVRDRTEGHIGGAVRALFPDLGVMVGHALTVKIRNEPGPPASYDGFWALFEALSHMPAPAVLVLQDDSGKPDQAAYAGEVMATMAKRLGAVGLVTDGGLRDLHEVHPLGFHFYAAHVVVSRGNFSFHEVGEPVTLFGQRIATGDILHGDVNGIVIVPPQTLDGLPAAIAEVRASERRLMDFACSPNFDITIAKSGEGY